MQYIISFDVTRLPVSDFKLGPVSHLYLGQRWLFQKELHSWIWLSDAVRLPHSSVRSDSLCTLGETMLPFNSVKLNWKLLSDSGNPPVLTCVRRVCVASSITGCDGFCLPVRTSYIPAWRQTPVAFTKRPGKKTKKHKKKGRRMLSPVKNCGLLLSLSVGPHNPSLSPCEEVMSSGFFGWRRGGRGGVRGRGAPKPVRTPTFLYTRPRKNPPSPLSSTWILALPGLTTCW